VTTIAPPELLKAAREIEKLWSSAVFSGIVGDTSHRKRASKHNSIEDNPTGSWAVTGKKDAAPPGAWSRRHAVALDISLSRTEQNKIHNHHKTIFNDKTDPRREYLAAFNGWDGKGSPGRYNLVTNTVSVTDSSHMWHEHDEGFYEHALDPAFPRAILSTYKLETKAQYLGSTPAPAPAPAKPAALAVDGKLGPKTIKRWQQIMGTKADGKISDPSALVKAVQRHLNAKLKLTGSTKLAVDGRGVRQDGKAYKTVRQLQRYLGTPQDGKMSRPKSEVVKALQRRLNTGKF
jgi:hypothetical protein